MDRPDVADGSTAGGAHFPRCLKHSLTSVSGARNTDPCGRPASLSGSPPLTRTALNLTARPGRGVPELHGERVAPGRLRRRPGILIDYQPVDRHRALGEPDDRDVKPVP